jgi:nitrous oxidase accessory protein
MRTLATTIVLLALAASVEARTWTVGARDADFPLIAPAIAAASDGDTIRINGGVYREDIVLSKRLAIIGIGHPIVFGRNAGTVMTVLADGCEVRGLTIELSGTGATNEMDAGIRVASNGNVIAGNRLRRVFYGIVVANASRNSITDNDIEGLAELPFGKRGDGIYLYRAPSNFVARNRISGQRDAIYFQYAPNGIALENTVRSSRYGLHDMFSDGTRIEGNTFADSSAGANIMNSRDIVLARNRFVGNRGIPGVGLTLKDCDASIVRDNEIAGNTRGALIEGSSRNRLIGNTFRGNDTAVTLFSSAEGNAFGGNAFVDNWSDLVLSGRDSRTAWTIDGRGNYWDKYRGFDFDGDGVGDAPHPLLGAFERIEGANAAARIFLRSPAAAGLEMAARLSGRFDANSIDPRPLVRARR